MSARIWEKNWKIVRELGAGGQGTAHEVVSINDPARRGVLKRLIKDKVHDDQARARMAIEAINLDKLAKLGVKVPARIEHNTELYGDTSIELYIVMEFVAGETLDRVVRARGGGLGLEQSIAITGELCRTIKAMHSQGVLHRDLKPANLMVRDFDKPDVVVLDLGLSFDRQENQESHTRTGETIKNELIALPERTLHGADRRDQRSDVTTIVCVFFYCLTGELPGYLRDERDRPPSLPRTIGYPEDFFHRPEKKPASTPFRCRL
jgi:serine/threonine-protein kinase